MCPLGIAWVSRFAGLRNAFRVSLKRLVQRLTWSDDLRRNNVQHESTSKYVYIINIQLSFSWPAFFAEDSSENDVLCSTYIVSPPQSGS